MTSGFVFGKFYPFHNGHKAMIDFAKNQCSKLYVIVCASDKESISSYIRASWIRDEYAGKDNIDVIEFDYLESDLPNSSNACTDISRVWANVFKQILPKVDYLITSEPYGDYVANYLGIKHILFDDSRSIVNVSATLIRNDMLRCWNHLPRSVKLYFQKTISILGTESTGKTSIVSALSKEHYITPAYETGREIIEDSKDFSYSQLYEVAAKHAQRIKLAKQSLSPVVVIDTDAYITMSYAEFVFKKPLDLGDNILSQSDVDLAFYLNRENSYIQDGTRLDLNQRNTLDESHRNILKRYKRDIIEISGTLEEKVSAVKNRVNRIMVFQQG